VYWHMHLPLGAGPPLALAGQHCGTLALPGSHRDGHGGSLSPAPAGGQPPRGPGPAGAEPASRSLPAFGSASGCVGPGPGTRRPSESGATASATVARANASLPVSVRRRPTRTETVRVEVTVPLPVRQCARPASGSRCKCKCQCRRRPTFFQVRERSHRDWHWQCKFNEPPSRELRLESAQQCIL
jgi:hypothetical protein